MLSEEDRRDPVRTNTQKTPKDAEGNTSYVFICTYVLSSVSFGDFWCLLGIRTDPVLSVAFGDDGCHQPGR